MGRATSDVNEAKSKMKYPPDMNTSRFILRWPDALPVRALRVPHRELDETSPSVDNKLYYEPGPLIKLDACRTIDAVFPFQCICREKDDFVL